MDMMLKRAALCGGESSERIVGGDMTFSQSPTQVKADRPSLQGRWNDVGAKTRTSAG